MGEGRGEGENTAISSSYVPLPFIPSHQGRGNPTFYETVKSCRHIFLSPKYENTLKRKCNPQISQITWMTLLIYEDFRSRLSLPVRCLSAPPARQTEHAKKNNGSTELAEGSPKSAGI